MKILRILTAQVIDITHIRITFTENLTPNLIVSNISIISQTPSVPDSIVQAVTISESILSIVCQPLTPLSSYFLQFQSIPNYPFESLNGDAIIKNDGVSNKVVVTAPLAPDDLIKGYLDSFLLGNIYNNDDDNALVTQYLKSLSVNLSRALYDIRQVKNENYLTISVKDESKVRGQGPFDRLNEEGAYEIVRVGFRPMGSTVSGSFQFNPFPSFPITLQKQTVIETLVPNSADQTGFFNTNSLTFNLHQAPVTKVDSIIFTLNTANPIYTYNIEDLGYQIKNSRYDQNFGFTYLGLQDNQIRISETILSDPLFSLKDIISANITYEYKNEGITVDPTTVLIYSTQTVSREALPPIINIFNLKHAPITDAANNIPKTGGVIFIDPNSNTGSLHPAFLFEIPFSLSAPPFMPGQYSIDYTTGTVYVYGADINNDGTGPSPPLASYLYRLTYKSEIDYVYDENLVDLVALPNGSLRGFLGNVNFKYEQVLIPNVDYISNPHVESLEERINNRIVALNAVTSANGPIINVFKIFNETSGEIYNLDRWYGNTIYFTYNTPPRLLQRTRERASFQVVTNELLFAYTTLINSSNFSIFKLFLNNNSIVADTEDSIASSFNTSMIFSNGHIFITEKWFNTQFTESQNINHLTIIGQYMVDYLHGIVYCAVANNQNTDIGTVTYKNKNISPFFSHVVSVNDIYYSINPLVPNNKVFSYISFKDGSILLSELDPSDESYLNKNTSVPYQILNGSIGAFVTGFVTGVTNQVKFVRSIFEYNDLSNSVSPLNFASTSTSSGFNINVGPITGQSFEIVQFDGINHTVTINQNIQFLSPNITYHFSIIRQSDSAILWNSNGIVVPGNPVILILPGINSPQTGDHVNVSYTFTVNDLSRVVIDYNKGDFFIDYTYLADEIIISYEYGDNQLDFRQNTNLPSGTTYYASYKVGALRDALFKNFGTLVNVPVLSTFDVDFNRERYRDALIAALTSFIQGPTISAISNIVQTISHIKPEIIEYAFLNWSLGSSLLYPQSINTTGSFKFLPAKYGDGALIDTKGQSISFPVNDNIRLEEGTFETWILPKWNGLDNNATLTFNILQDGYPVEPSSVFIGSFEYHPTIINGMFSVEANVNVMTGTPNTNKDGIFIYYDLDSTGNFYRWYLRVLDGYVIPDSSNYKIVISSTGKFYDNISITFPQPTNMSMFTRNNTITLSITGGAKSIDNGITFISDIDHYVLDFGKETGKNRLSIYKDSSGYMNFRVYDKEKRMYSISADVSAWRAGDLHHVAASWKLNTRNNRDEMHLFIDGFEVPNIIRYGQKLQPYLHEKFRTVDPEEIIGLPNRDIVGSVDLQTVTGSTSVTSSINFSSFHILPGDTIFIDEPGFNTLGYTIASINGQTLALNTPMPQTISNGIFSVNRTSFIVKSNINITPNIAVSIIHTFLTGTDITGFLGSNIVFSVSSDFTNVLPGYSITINNNSLPITYTILQVTSHSLVINDKLPINLSPTSFQIYSNVETEIPGVRAIRPSYSISEDVNFNNIITISNNVLSEDLILIRTLGLNNKNVKQRYYVWSDGYENVLMTRLPPPISLDEANITKIILPTVAIGPSNSTLVAGNFISSNFITTQPTNSNGGRTISVTISGNNVNFSNPVYVTINGTSNGSTISETIAFTAYGKLNFVHPYSKINYINVTITPINATRNAVNLEVKEAHSMTYIETDGYAPIVRFSYPIGSGYNLFNDSPNSVRDDSFLFSALDNNNYLLIGSPSSVAGYYIINGMSSDRKSLFITPVTGASLPLPSFTGGVYQVLNVSTYRSGLQQGFFTFEINKLPGQPYLLNHGYYELNYSTYTNIDINPISDLAYLGSDFNIQNHLDGIINDVKIYSVMLTDTRVGETTSANQRSITKDFNSLKALSGDSNTLMLITLNTFPFANEAKFYSNVNTDKQHFQSSVVINENFGNSTVILDEPIILENNGILDTRKQGTIEFWVSPLIDTGNDPVDRYYFDAFGAITEETISTNSVSIKLSAPASKILNVKLAVGDQKTDYFAGGRLEIDTQHAIQEEGTSISNNSVIVSSPVFQVVTVKIAGDPTGTDYFTGGSISLDGKTIFLGKLLPQIDLPLIITYQATSITNSVLNTQIIRLNKKLPYQNTKVIINYIPQGLQGDRIAIFKDPLGYLNFGITASEIDYIIRAPIYWTRDTWHRVKASYKINNGIGNDEMRLFIDGYEYTNVLFGSEILLGSFPIIMGQAIVGGFTPNDGYSFLENIIFRDSINQLYIGSRYDNTAPLFSLIDNFRISNISRPIYAPFGEPIDVNYSSNLSTVFPVTQDLYTTFLIDFDKMFSINTNFAVLINKETGSFDFTVNVLDSLGIINSSSKSREALESLIEILKPANSRVFIKYE